MTIPGREDVAGALVADAMRYFEGLGLNYVSYWGVEGHPNERVIKEFGFLDARNDPYVLLTRINVNSEWDTFMTSSAEQISFQHGDTDWI